MLRSLLGALFPKAGGRSRTAGAPSLDGAEALLAAGRLDEAERLAGRRLAALPDDADGLSVLAAVAIERLDVHQACLLAERIGRVPAARADHLIAASEILRRAGREATALELAVAACDRDPRSAAAWIQRATLLETLARFGEAYEAYRVAVPLDPHNRDVHSSMLFMLYVSGLFDPPRILDEHRAWAARHADPVTARAAPHANVPDPDRRLTVGYVSADFRRHVVSRFVEPVLRAHDRASFAVHCYSSCTQPDDRTAELRALADCWRDISALGDAEAGELIRADGVDILVDLGGHTRSNRLMLFARRPAPVQVSWLGYLGTTGMKAMDYCLTDDFADPPGVADGHYAERLLRLPVPQWCYAPPPEAPEVTPLPALARGFVVLGSIAGYARLNAEIFAAWARILNSVPSARLRVFGVRHGDQTDRLFEALERARVDLSRLELVARLEYRDYLIALQDLDIVLAAHPYSGATTTCDALWLGVPVVARAGDTRPARSAASILSGVGLGELVAGSWDEYCAIAVRLAADHTRLAGLRAGLRTRLAVSPVVDAARFVPHLERAHRAAWADWCSAR